ncbi:hypothetical protein E2562_033765 [Oryza meyeriana var. granulata]|uniref:Uncharacterized protein n=1 Tax=Oryza meyeriana var. granulata TaxID=110450 RepID=A0A6G1C1M6_9ORYZ|nr:hypothetical protein E2562_033907 [Oryza meyeriana var. granulata]KAF0930601.1 hypothetical protein E2562_033765 [Oryza meyeriana var. granulata]
MVAGLTACGVIVAAISTASDLTQAFRMGYLTLTSPLAIFLSQAAGTALGCVISPVIFRAFQNGGDGITAKSYRGIDILGVSHHGLPRHSVLLCELAFSLALALGVLREASSRRRWRIHRYIPSTAAMAVAFFVSPKVSIGMFTGSMATYLWGRGDDSGHGARLLSPEVACGLICGDGFGSLLSSMLTQAPICIKFLS